MFKKMKLRMALIYFGLIALSIFSLLPFAWMISTSFKNLSETFNTPVNWIPKVFTMESYKNIWTIQNFGVYFKNSAIAASFSTLFSVILAALAGYGFSRFRFKYGKSLMVFVLVSQMFPGILLVIPYFSMTSKMGLINSYTALIIAYTSFSLPFCLWMLKGFFDSIPIQLDEAAMVDGCSRLKTFFHIILPVSLPGIAATVIFAFLQAWNEFLFALVLTTTPKMYTMTVGIANNIGQFRIQWNDLMAASVVATLPTIILYSFLEKYLVQGLTAGAVKG